MAFAYRPRGKSRRAKIRSDPWCAHALHNVIMANGPSCDAPARRRARAPSCAAHMILSRVAGGTQGSTIGMVNPAYLSYSKALKFDSWVTLGTMLTHE